jgi:hypothetical protein
LRPCGETEERRSMKTLLVGAVGVLALQALLVLGYLAVNRQDPIILNPDKGNLNENGIAMVMTCGEGSGSGVLDKVPPTEKMQARGRGEGRYRATVTSTTITTPCTTHASTVLLH